MACVGLNVGIDHGEHSSHVSLLFVYQYIIFFIYISIYITIFMYLFTSCFFQLLLAGMIKLVLVKKKVYTVPVAKDV